MIKLRLLQLARFVATVAIVLLAVSVAVALWHRYENDPWTRDGHVRADVVRVSSDVPGLVTDVHVRDNQLVHAGDLLFVVDRPRYKASLDEAKANIASASATLDLARKTSRRDLSLGDLVAVETHEENVARVLTATAALAQARSALEVASLNLRRTTIRASVDGTVTNLDLHPGDYIAVGAQAMALVAVSTIRVEGYFEETKLEQIRVGDLASVRLMGSPTLMKGHVDSIAGGIADDQRSNSGNLLPTVAPTFTWVRLAQRIPVRIRIDRVAPGTALIPGRTATVTILPQGSTP
ncbi:efflux RND transporter periplasmic adaptor subunit [Sphingomonas sp. BIUV-7]|uniref:Efflux RND transporter periplasmic adaptor subunit n=1 Tax=Sphingomonas natans TaxID=3063330 RepID=A0ABT8Y909_9SPHN|nr:efflux RND transporter periplasmic adaptor subunit [Sphingomonas sp. BIUV-7]MDO6414194.1 efflux RND transporter periplasmic adaptor subunit [Sphingomonas sp. BIUV-7]